MTSYPTGGTLPSFISLETINDIPIIVFKKPL